MPFPGMSPLVPGIGLNPLLMMSPQLIRIRTPVMGMTPPPHGMVPPHLLARPPFMVSPRFQGQQGIIKHFII
jgi:hypothetical protein